MRSVHAAENDRLARFPAENFADLGRAASSASQSHNATSALFLCARPNTGPWVTVYRGLTRPSARRALGAEGRP